MSLQGVDAVCSLDANTVLRQIRASC